MSKELKRLCDLSEEARVISGELYRLIKLVGDVELDNETSGEWPEHFTATTYGAVRSAAALMARHLNQLNDDLADDLQNETDRRGKG